LRGSGLSRKNRHLKDPQPRSRFYSSLCFPCTAMPKCCTN
jgi:hypothetical protein